MIELPETILFARQFNAILEGKRITSVVRGNTPHKFAFYTGTPEEYEAILVGKTIGDSVDYGSNFLVTIEPGYVLVLGGGGERILLHDGSASIPKKHQLLLGFEDGSYMSVSVQGWGSLSLMRPEEVLEHPYLGPRRISPLDEVFTYPYFAGLFDELESGSTASVKFFLISKPGVWGIGNGCLQDILFRAKMHPRHRAIDLTEDERRALYGAIRDVLGEMVAKGGRDSERDLYNQPGRYRRLMDSTTAGQPCPACGTPIEKIAYLGGACYFCPQCQM